MHLAPGQAKWAMPKEFKCSCKCLHLKSKHMYRHKGFMTFRKLEIVFGEISTILIMLSCIADLKKWSFSFIEDKTSSLEVLTAFSPIFLCTVGMCFKAVSFNFYLSLVPRFSVGILKHGTTCVPKRSYIASLLSVKDSYG